MSHPTAENRAPLRIFRSRALKPLLHTCRTLARGVVGLASTLLVPALLWVVPAAGTLALSAAIAEGARYPQAVVFLAFVGALSTACAYLATARERQPDEASLWGASALWLALFGAAVFDLSDLVRGAREAAFVWLVGIVVFLTLWVPYVWSRRTVLPHAVAWTLAAAAVLPYALAWLFAAELASWRVPSPLAGAVLSVAAGVAACVFASRRLPASARVVVLTAAVCLLVPVWLEAIPEAVVGLGLPVIGAVLVVVLMGVERVSWHALLCERGAALIPLCAAVATVFALAPDALALTAWFGGALAVAAWGIFVVRRSGPDAAAQVDAVRAAVTRVRTGA
ncbi:MAG: hypothetical protein ACRD1B_00160, partial [Thermoanaerobaculia bacterium]